MPHGRDLAILIGSGTVIVVATIVAWLYGESHGIDTTPLFIFTTPIVTALFLVKTLSSLGQDVRSAKDSLNGGFDERLKGLVASALADRDASIARARAPREPTQ